MRCAVLGRPIAHSLSPVLHRAAYRALGLDWEYDAVEIGEEQLADFLAGLDDRWRGLSLTMPLKRAVVPLLDETTELVELSGAANTVLLEAGRRIGHNTDVPGAVAAIRERTDAVPHRVVVLGGGATAASVLLAVAGLGCSEATLLVREPARAAATVEVVGNHPAAPRLRVLRLREDPGPADLAVSTVPAAAQSADVVAPLAAAPTVFEVVYDPWPTPLARAARAQDRVLVTGLDLLVHQAVEQVRLMTGIAEVPVAAMRRAGEQALSARADEGDR